MHSTMLIFYFILFYSSSLPSYGLAATPTNETDQIALLQLKARITNDPLRVFSSWNQSKHFCKWRGVACGRRHQRVVGLSLQSSGLEGSLSPHVGNLSFLRFLNLNNNSFRGAIPQEMGYLFRLQFLGLENNSFSGEIPSNLSRCRNLQYLRLGNNELVGKVPGEIGSLSSLREIYLYFNNLSGEIPPSFGNLSSLEVISAAGNQFEGRIAETLGQLKKLYYIAFGRNRLSGEIPSSIYNISSLMYLHFPENQLRGSLPSDLGFTLPNLEVINVAVNQFTGPIPASISNATNLMRLTIPVNGFSRKVPTLENLYKLRWLSISQNQLGNGEEGDLEFLGSLTNVTGLEILAIGDNKFGGIFPESIGNLSTQLRRMFVESNQISGSIPDGIGNLVNLESLTLQNNQLTGLIPSSIGNIRNLKELMIQGNRLSGNIPSSLGNLNLLTALNLQRNNLDGFIPSSLGRCRNLVLLDLSDNNLNGNIPLQVTALSSLSIYLDVSRNQLNGSIPLNIGNLTNLAGLDVSDNRLSGEIPASIGSCTSLEQLFMRGNSFRGNIPLSFGSLRGIRNIDLSRNNFTGEIPRYFEDFLLLQNLNLSYNDFEGEVPSEGVFRNFTAVSLVGNSNLCGGIEELRFSACPITGSKGKQSPSVKVIIPIAIGILLFLTVLLCSVIVYFRRKKNRGSPPSLPTLASVFQVSYENLLKATDGFSSNNLIGTGGFGSVYKGILDGMVVAVKVLNLQLRGASKSFIAECEALRSVRHRNLVKIMTACASVDFQGNDFKALVYDYMVNGSLDEWLHPRMVTDGEVPQALVRSLGFLQRLNIVIDVACALDYLHNYCETPIVHCDLKPSNVLLDDEMTGHVGDFGLAKFLLEANNNNISTNQTSSVGIRGTVGYAASEYGMGSEVSTQGDVYSYGILLLEMFTGKRPTDEIFHGNLNLHTYVKEALSERVAGIVDPILLREKEEKETRAINTRASSSNTGNYNIMGCLIMIMGIGVSCSSELPRDRMNMDDVASQLLSIRSKFLEAQAKGERQTRRKALPRRN